MKNILSNILIGAALMAFSLEASAAPAHSLRCEALDSPLGIDSTNPHFSWKNNELQKTWRIQVASSEKALLSGKADLWDSGERTSDESVMVPYEGKQLSSRQLCFWRVAVNGEWSAPDRFSVGIIGDDRMEGEYVAAFPGQDLTDPVIYKQFTYKYKGKTAFLHVNSLGYHEVWINGQRISDKVFAPAVSQMDKRSLIVTYDVTGFLRKGTNDIAIWASPAWYNNNNLFKAEIGGPVVKACLDVLDKGSWKSVLSTDKTWKGVKSGYSDTSRWVSGQYGGEEIDAAQVPSDLTAAALDLLSPVQVQEVTVSKPVASPQMCVGTSVKETIQPVIVVPAGKDRWIVDMGVVSTAMTEIHLKGQNAGDKVDIIYSDEARRTGGNDWGRDYLICCGDPQKDVFRSKFNYHVFRFITLEGVKEKPSVKDIKAIRFGTCTGPRSTFSSSDPDLDKVYSLLTRTMDNLTHNGYMVDCASIERLGYGGDGNASALSLQTTFDVQSIYMNWLQAWIDTQREDGHLRHTAPSPVGAGGGPFWCSFIVQAPWKVYMNYGDTRLLERCYPSMLKWIEYVDANSVDGLLKKWADDETRSWYLGDWLAPRGTNVTDEETVDLVNNCALVQSYDQLVKIARLLGKESDAKSFQQRKDNLVNVINNKFYHAEEGIYGTGSQLDMIYPMLVGAVPQGIADAVKAKLFERTETINKGHIGVGLVGVACLSEWAAKSGSVDYVYNMLKKRDYPGYLYMIDNGATATWEDWDNPRSQLHNCFNGLVSWFYQALGGITADTPGFKHVTIAPQIPADLRSASVEEQTPYGAIKVSWEKKEGRIALHVEVPAGVTATIEGNEYVCGSYDLTMNAR